MQNIKNNYLFEKIFTNLVFFLILMTMIFTRSFMGIKLFGFRLGELIVGFGLVLLIFFYNIKYS